MAGFYPVASVPVATVPAGDGGTITIVSPATGRLLFRAGGGQASLGTSNYNITVGHVTTPTPDEDFWGWSSTLGFGSIDNNLMPNGDTILGLYWENNHDAGTRTMYLVVSGVQTNDGWENITVDGHVHQRSSATFSTASGNTVWSWSTTDHFGIVEGAVKTASISGSAPIVETGGFEASKLEVVAWLDPPDGLAASKIETVLWIEPKMLSLSKMEVALWVEPDVVIPPAGTRRRVSLM